MARITPRSKCPCFSGRTYGSCCRPYHRRRELPEPVSLMRSRFSAYAMGNSAYILETSGEDRGDEQAWLVDVERFCAHTRFLSLSILRVEPGKPVAHVSFRAGIEQGGVDASFSERSRFELTDRWRYVSGERLS